MKLLTVTLGIQFAEWLPSREPRCITVHLDQEFTPDQVFQACNRIDSLVVDIAGLDDAWQRHLRYELEINEFPSMSRKDTIHLESIGTWTCESRGWSFVPADRTLPL